MYYEPDEIIHENSKFFDDATFRQVVQKKCQKDVISRPMARGEPPRWFDYRRIAFNILKMGVPGSRDRSWRHLSLTNILRRLVDEANNEEEFKKLFFCQRVVDCSIYHNEQTKAAHRTHQVKYLMDRGEYWQIEAKEKELDEQSQGMTMGCEPYLTDAEIHARIDELAKELGPFCDAVFKTRALTYQEMADMAFAKVCVLLFGMQSSFVDSAD